MSVCRVLGATDRGCSTSRGYRAAKTWPASQRAQRDAALIAVVKELHQANYGVYGVHKMWHAMGPVLVGRWVATKSPGSCA